MGMNRNRMLQELGGKSAMARPKKPRHRRYLVPARTKNLRQILVHVLRETTKLVIAHCLSPWKMTDGRYH